MTQGASGEAGFPSLINSFVGEVRHLIGFFTRLDYIFKLKYKDCRQIISVMENSNVWILAFKINTPSGPFFNACKSCSWHLQVYCVLLKSLNIHLIYFWLSSFCWKVWIYFSVRGILYVLSQDLSPNNRQEGDFKIFSLLCKCKCKCVYWMSIQVVCWE